VLKMRFKCFGCALLLCILQFSYILDFPQTKPWTLVNTTCVLILLQEEHGGKAVAACHLILSSLFPLKLILIFKISAFFF